MPMPKLNLVGTATFANGRSFSIEQMLDDQGKALPRFVISDLAAGKLLGYAGSVAKAWDSVRYMANVSPRTMVSPGVEASGDYWDVETATVAKLLKEAA